MRWNIAPECVSAVVLCIIWVYSRRGNPIPSLKDHLFQACFLVTFCAMTSNICSTLLIAARIPALVPLNWAVTMFYFLTTPLMGLVYLAYTFANLYDDDRLALRRILQFSIPGVLYAVLVVLTPFTHLLFSLSAEGDYAQGPLLIVTYLIFYLYCLVCLLCVLRKWRSIQPALRNILFSFPLVAGVVIVVQLAFPDIILTGSAATCALLIIYLFLQNKQISIDHLTQLPNRQAFLRMLELSIRKSPGAEFVVVVLSLRDFKLINDVHGQHSGDALLAALAAYLRRELGTGERQLYRYSGDEFAIVLDERSVSRAEALIAKVCARMTQPWRAGDCSCLLGTAVGVVRYPASAGSTEGLINGIESAVSLAKQQGPMNNICYCDAALLERAARRQQITAILRESVKNDSFEVFYQPILDVASNRFLMAEALLRLNNTPLGPISPVEFIPIAEECGLIVELTYLVLDKVCRCIRRALDRGLVLDGVNVNFSPVQFTQPDLVERIVDMVGTYGFPFSKMKVEITESTLAESPEAVTDFMNHMHEYGVRIGLDDFGTGFSNLSSVTDLPLDVIKLDKSLVWGAMKNRRTAIIIQNLSRAFMELGMTVLAEGVETEEQSRFVRACGCGLIQGFLYARPMAEEQFLQFMELNRTKEAFTLA